ncbi:MAG: asparagine synthase (glutamine-hydrolyzing) [Hungateiclostridium thermocellum]|nr:asparagine synthase (glutamine-hydrolyzing) [Acetivibrio thermocellus]
MCGIAGWINLKSDLTNQKEILNSMIDRLTPRGPDASGSWISPNALIAHKRLIVVDPEGGIQPMVRRQGENTYVITYNGELYNTADLRNELESRGHEFLTCSDTEVLLVSYIEWGAKCVEHLNGIYAFGIWDEGKKRLFLGRDRFGVKPLFYAQRGDSLIFGSELKALLANPLVEPKLDAEGLAEIFALGPARTPGHGIFKDVYELKPAHSMIFDINGIQIRKYWSLESYPHTDSEKATISKVRDLVLDAITRQLVADVPVCTFLSGGLDSSAITAVASKTFASQGKGQLNTFSVDYVDNDIYFKPSMFQPNSDEPWIKKMSESFNTCHHYVKFDTPQLVDALIDAVKARDLPGMADIDSSLFLFCREVKKFSVVALSGECADEIFGGYPWFHNEKMLFADTFPWSVSVHERTKILSPEILNLIKPEEYIQRRYRETLSEVPHLKGENRIEARRREIFYLNINWFMATLLDRKDRMSMASGLEVRVPFCDHRLVQYVWNIPWELKMYNKREKGLLRQALKGILPDDIIERKKSPYPKTHNPSYKKAVSKWLLEILNDSSSPLHQLIDVKVVRSMAEGNSDNTDPWFGQLMAQPQMLAYLIQVDFWLRDNHISIV